MIFITALLIILLLVLGLSFGLYRFVLYSPVGNQNDPRCLPTGEQFDPKQEEMRRYIDDLLTRPSERVSIVSLDGLRLVADYYPGQPGRPVHICCHGYRSLGPRDFCGIAQTLLEEGDGVLLIHQRAQGASEGHTITFGVREREDVLLWARYAEQRFGQQTPLFLYGLSMGAATVLMALALPLPKNVKGVMADCPFDSPREILVHTAQKVVPHAGLLWPFLQMGAFLCGHGLRFGTVCCHEAVQKATVPILILHGEEDRFVPSAMSAPIAAAAPNRVTRLLFPRAGHGMSFFEDTERYVSDIRAFTENCKARCPST